MGTELAIASLDAWVRHDQIPKDFPLQLNTSTLDILFPGLADHYGPDHTVDIEFGIYKVENTRSRANDKTIKFDADLGLKFWVNDVNGTHQGEVAVDAELK